MAGRPVRGWRCRAACRPRPGASFGPLRLPDHVVALPETAEAVTSRHCRSAVLVDSRALTPTDPGRYLHADVLGQYVAGIAVKTENGARLTVVSVHASPNPLTAEHREAAQPDRLRRQSERQVWYADLVGEELLRVLDRTKPDPVLAAGDFNEAYGWDASHGGDSSAEFFRRLGDGGFVDVTQAAWRREVSTHTSKPYQVDRIYGSRGLNVQVAIDPGLSLGPDDGLSDHLAISFSVQLD